MKKIFSFIKNLVIMIYIILIIFVTICLLSHNDYKVTVFGDTTWVPVVDEDLEPKFTVGDLLIIKKDKVTDIQKGDEIFFYRTITGETTINYAVVEDVEIVTPKEATYTIGGDYKFSSVYYIGKVSSAKIIPKVGSLMSILQSKFGFLFLGVFPSLLAFLFTAYSLLMEATTGETEDDLKDNIKKSKTSEEKKALVEEMMKTMTEDEKKALIMARLKNMTEEEKKALVEKKKNEGTNE